MLVYGNSHARKFGIYLYTRNSNRNIGRLHVHRNIGYLYTHVGIRLPTCNIYIYIHVYVHVHTHVHMKEDRETDRRDSLTYLKTADKKQTETTQDVKQTEVYMKDRQTRLTYPSTKYILSLISGFAHRVHTGCKTFHSCMCACMHVCACMCVCVCVGRAVFILCIYFRFSSDAMAEKKVHDWNDTCC
jgi:hypothetical protein